MDTPAEILISTLIDHCQNQNMVKGLEAALQIVQNAGYFNIDDLEEMDDEAIYQEALDLTSLTEEEMA